MFACIVLEKYSPKAFESDILSLHLRLIDGQNYQVILRLLLLTKIIGFHSQCCCQQKAVNLSPCALCKANLTLSPKRGCDSDHDPNKRTRL